MRQRLFKLNFLFLTFLLIFEVIFGEQRIAGAWKAQKKVKLRPELLSTEKKTPLAFRPFVMGDFSRFLTPDGNVIIKGQLFSAEDFLKQINEIEKALNEIGDSLRNPEPLKIRLNYSSDLLLVQKEFLEKEQKDLELKRLPQIVCTGNCLKPEDVNKHPPRPKDFMPLDWKKTWDFNLGNDLFGIDLDARLQISGQEKNMEISPYFRAGASIFEVPVEILCIKTNSNLMQFLLFGKEVGKLDLRQDVSKSFQVDRDWSKSWNGDWSVDLEMPLGSLPIILKGTFGLEGKAGVDLKWMFNVNQLQAELAISPRLKFDVYADLGASVEFVEVGVDGRLTLLEDSLKLLGNIKFNEFPERFFLLSGEGKNSFSFLNGSLYIYGKIDYIIGTKKFEVELCNFGSNISYTQQLFKLDALKIAAEKDHLIWLKIDKLQGITPFTARNQKLEVEPLGFEVLIDVAGRIFQKKLKDYNRNGIYGDAIGEFEPISVEIPLLSFNRVPITIQVFQKYKIGQVEFKTRLDLAEGSWRDFQICYDPCSRKFSGTRSGGEKEEIISTGDTNLFGERNHRIYLQIGPKEFRATPVKAK